MQVSYANPFVAVNSAAQKEKASCVRTEKCIYCYYYL